MRAVIYARYSSENQREASIEDQVEVCRRYAERQGWTVVALYDDRAASGASTMGRPGFLRMIADAEAGRLDVVVCEAIDRLGRKLADVAAAFDRLSFSRVTVHATAIGLVTQMHIGIMGTMAQMALSDLREKTKRGQLGRARAGRIPGGLAYGYEVVPPAPGSREAGERRIKPDEADQVLRIFRAYAAGKSPRVIARDLNAAGAPGPGGRPWGDTTIRGQADRGTGLLNNSLYIGKLRWNRCSYVKDPRTGRRVARPNGTDQWEEVDVPDLRIIDQVLWEKVRARQASLQFDADRPQPLNGAHRSKFLLSGLLTCGACGGGYTIIGRDRYGCATRRCKGTCDNGITIRRQHIESRVLGGLKQHMLAPELVAEFVRVFAEEMATSQRIAAGAGERLRSELADVERRLEAVLKAIENGAWSNALQVRLQALEARKIALTREVREALAPSSVVRLHPNAAEIYRKKVAELETALGTPDICGEAAEALGAMIERVVLTPNETAPDRLRAELHGDLAVILSAAGATHGTPKHSSPPRSVARWAAVGSCQLSVVAGAGFEPATFRL